VRLDTGKRKGAIIPKGQDMKLKTLKDLYLDELRDVYDAENQIVKALPKMVKAATSVELQEALREHLEKTRGHVKRLEQVFDAMGERRKRRTCEGLKGLLEEGKELMEEDAEPAVMDAGLIAGAQRVEHYEMAAYGSLRTWAQQLGDQKASRLLEETLNEEKEADQALSEIASAINSEAAETKGAKEFKGRISGANKRFRGAAAGR
jgi:ferritin-like metal-binding protein YciE